MKVNTQVGEIDVVCQATVTRLPRKGEVILRVGHEGHVRTEEADIDWVPRSYLPDNIYILREKPTIVTFQHKFENGQCIVVEGPQGDIEPGVRFVTFSNNGTVVEGFYSHTHAHQTERDGSFRFPKGTWRIKKVS